MTSKLTKTLTISSRDSTEQSIHQEQNASETYWTRYVRPFFIKTQLSPTHTKNHSQKRLGMGSNRRRSRRAQNLRHNMPSLEFHWRTLLN